MISAKTPDSVCWLIKQVGHFIPVCTFWWTSYLFGKLYSIYQQFFQSILVDIFDLIIYRVPFSTWPASVALRQLILVCTYLSMKIMSTKWWQRFSQSILQLRSNNFLTDSYEIWIFKLLSILSEWSEIFVSTPAFGILYLCLSLSRLRLHTSTDRHEMLKLRTWNKSKRIR